jgi:hypothetical protein
VFAHDTGVDLGARKESQQNGAKAREKVDPVRDLQSEQVACNRAHHDLDESDGYGNAN